MDMRRAKKELVYQRRAVFVTVVIFAVFLYSKQYSHAADEIFITYNDQRVKP